MENLGPATRGNPRWKLQLSVGAVVLIACLAFGAFVISHNDTPARADSAQATTTTTTTTPVPEIGPIPKSAWQPNGGIDLAQVPNFVPALSDGKVVGFIPKAELFSGSSSPIYEATPLNGTSPTPAPSAADIAAEDAQLIKTVYASDLTTVVGHMYPGVGFVPVGETPPAPKPPITSTTPPGS